MSVQHVYMDTDVCKAGQYGSITPTPTSFNFSLNGSADMYLDADIEYNDDPSVTFSPKLNMHFTLDGTNITSSPPSIDNSLTLRFTIKIYNQSRTQVYSQQYTPSNNSGAYYWNPYQSYTLYERTGEYGNPSRIQSVQCAHGMSGNLSISLPSSIYGQEFFFTVQVEKYYRYSSPEWSYCGTTREYHTYAPFRLSVTAPGHVYINGVNQFTAAIAANYYSSLNMKLTCVYNGSTVSVSDIDQPVRNENYPYITQGTNTNAIYWNGGCYALKTGGYTNFQYSLIVELAVIDPSNSSFRALVSKTTKSGNAEIRSQDDFTAYSMDVTITDLAGYYDQFGVMLRNTNSVIRAAVSATLRYGANASAYIVKFGTTNSTLIANMDRTADVVYDQYVPATGTTGTTRCFVMAHGYQLDTETFSASIVNYSAPSYTNLSVHRCNQDGTANDNGGYVKIEWGVMIVSINNQNAKSLVIDHPQGRQSYNPLDDYVMSGELIVEADTDSSYNIVFMLSDSIYNGSNAIVRSIQLSTAGVIMDWLYGGKGVAFGKVAERENALEVGSDWDLIAYKMMLNDVNVVNWIKEIASRMNAIEQFASNIGSTSQFQVTFYNDGELLERQWVLSGYDATAPDEEPTRESSPTQSFSFVGWALTNGATTADPNALLNIRSYRSIYAAFTAATRYYYVAFFNESSLITSFSQIQYQASPSYSDYSGLSPTPPQGASFVGYMPSGRFVESNVKAMAQFYYDQEITDSWAEIVAACADGTYKDKYKPGNWKMLDLGTEGNIKMRIKGLNMHRMIGQNKAPITWEADNKLATNKAMNSTVASKVYGDETEDGFTFAGTTPQYFYSRYEHDFKINELADSNDNKAVMTVTVTNASSSAFNIVPGFYRPSASSGHVKLTSPTVLNPVEKDMISGQDILTSWGVELSAGGSFTYTVEMYGTSFSGGPLQFFVLEYSNPNTYNSRLSISIDVEQVRKPAGYEGGAVGGFGKSDLHKYLQETIKPLFPEELRLGLKKMRLIQKSLKSKGESPFYEFVDNDWLETDLFIPSSEEIVGNNAGNTKGVDFDMFAPAYRRKGNTSSSNFYWCRDVYDVPTSTITEKLSYFSAITGYTDSLLIVKQHYVRADYAKPVYICFCT